MCISWAKLRFTSCAGRGAWMDSSSDVLKVKNLKFSASQDPIVGHNLYHDHYNNQRRFDPLAYASALAGIAQSTLGNGFSVEANYRQQMPTTASGLHQMKMVTKGGI